MANRLDREINVELGPIETAAMGLFDVAELPDRDITKPGKLVKRQEELLVLEEKPETMLRDCW